MKINVKDLDQTTYKMVKQNGDTLWIPEFEYDAVMGGRA